MSLPIEESWRPVVGYEGLYEVSDQGHVRSIRRTGAKGGLKAATRDGRGYLQVLLCKDGRQRSATVHQLVAHAFIGSRPNGLQIRHLDGDSHNNAIGNLAYGTPSENAMDQVLHGTHSNAQKTRCPAGHSYNDPDVLIVYRGMRYCRNCQRANRAKRTERERARRAVA